MSFDDYLNQQGMAVGQTLVHSTDQLPFVTNPTDQQAADLVATAQRIAVEIGRKFDSEHKPVSDTVMSLFADMQRYWSAPVPWGSLPTPPPAALVAEVAGQLGRARSLQAGYEADANLLERAGAPEFKAYLAHFIADTDAALKTMGETNMAPVGGSSANWGVPPGPDPHFNMGMMMGGPMMGVPLPGGPMMGAPLPFAPSPAPMGGGFDPAAAYRQRQADFEAQQARHREQQAAFDRANANFNAYLKS